MKLIKWIKNKLRRPRKTSKEETKNVIKLQEKYEKWAKQDKIK